MYLYNWSRNNEAKENGRAKDVCDHIWTSLERMILNFEYLIYASETRPRFFTHLVSFHLYIRYQSKTI